ncbi:hypothetical protein ACMGD3_15740 [Lysinibacillus sphaericus]
MGDKFNTNPSCQFVNLYSDISAQGYEKNDMSAAYLSLKERCKIKQI